MVQSKDGSFSRSEAPGSNPSVFQYIFMEIFSDEKCVDEEKSLMLLGLTNSALWFRGQWLEKVNQAHLVLASGKTVAQKKKDNLR